MLIGVKKKKILTPEPKSKFILISCPDCGNEQVSFDRASTIVKCHICGRVLVEPSSGKAKVRGRLIKVLE